MGFTRRHKGKLHGTCFTICDDGRYAIEEYKDDTKISETLHKPEKW